MKKTILSIAVIAAAVFTASCQKENLQENTASEGSASVFTATIETGANTKTTVERIGGNPAIYKTYWESTDQISIDGSIYTATPDDTDKTKATFNKTSGADPTAPFHAYFPASMYSDSKATLLETYDYEDGKYNMPMYAESSSLDLSFKNLCGVLAIKVYHSVFSSIKSIEVSSDQQMNGEFTAKADGTLTFNTEGVTLTEDNRKVTLNFASPKSIASDGSATFYIPVPAGTHKPLTIKVSDGTTAKTMDTKKTVGVTITRNTVYPITFADNSNSNDPGDVEMKMGSTGTSKLIWATKNLGAISIASCGETCFGDYYAWGETEPYYITRSWDESGKKRTLSTDSWYTDKASGYTSQSYYGGDSFIEWNPKPYNDDSKNLNAGNDAATIKIGNGWRMPTAQEFEDLVNACGGVGIFNRTTYASTKCDKSTNFDKGIFWCGNYDGVAGCLFCDGNNKLFFPAAGMIANKNHGANGTTGYYWSSSCFQDTDGNYSSAYSLFIPSSSSVALNPKATNSKRFYGIPIRPVKDISPANE